MSSPPPLKINGLSNANYSNASQLPMKNKIVTLSNQTTLQFVPDLPYMYF
jgi:hypothetical protein